MLQDCDTRNNIGHPIRGAIGVPPNKVEQIQQQLNDPARKIINTGLLSKHLINKYNYSSDSHPSPDKRLMEPQLLLEESTNTRNECVIITKPGVHMHWSYRASDFVKITGFFFTRNIASHAFVTSESYTPETIQNLFRRVAPVAESLNIRVLELPLISDCSK